MKPQPPPAQVPDSMPLPLTALPWWKDRKVYQWSALGLSVATAIPGAVLLGIDGKQTCDWPAAVQCPEVYDTWVPGAALVSVASALAVTCLVLTLTGDDEQAPPPTTAGLTIAGDGFGFGISGSF